MCAGTCLQLLLVDAVGHAGGLEPAAHRFTFLTALPQKFETATGNPRLNAILVEADEASGRATDIERISLSAGELQELADIADDRPVRSSV